MPWSTCSRSSDAFIESEIAPLQAADDNECFFDHRREFARTDLERGGVPSREWETLLAQMSRRADAAGFCRHGLPEALGGREGGNLDMAVIREHLAARGLGLHDEFQSESSIVANPPFAQILHSLGSDAQRAMAAPMITSDVRIAFGLTEPDHGSDAKWLETAAVRDGDGWRINSVDRFNSGMHDVDARRHLRAYVRGAGRRARPGRAHGPDRQPRRVRRLPVVHVQHALRARPNHAAQRGRRRGAVLTINTFAVSGSGTSQIAQPGAHGPYCTWDVVAKGRLTNSTANLLELCASEPSGYAVAYERGRAACTVPARALSGERGPRRTSGKAAPRASRPLQE